MKVTCEIAWKGKAYTALNFSTAILIKQLPLTCPFFLGHHKALLKHLTGLGLAEKMIFVYTYTNNSNNGPYCSPKTVTIASC